MNEKLKYISKEINDFLINLQLKIKLSIHFQHKMRPLPWNPIILNRVNDLELNLEATNIALMDN